MKNPGNFRSSLLVKIARQFAVAFLVSGIIILIYESFEDIETGMVPSWLNHLLTVVFISVTVSFFAGIIRKKQDEYTNKIRNMDDSRLKNQEKYRMLFENLPFGFQLNEIIYDKKGEPAGFRNIEVNKYYEKISGFEAGKFGGKDKIDLSADEEMNSKFMLVGITGKPFSQEYYSKAQRKHLRVSAYSPEPNQFAVLTEDISIRKKAEERQLLLGKVLEILNRRSNWSYSIRDILHEIKSFSEIDAIGIRLEKENDFPYYANEGFSDEFLIEENSICSRLKDGSINFSSEGDPILECTCGMVISGKIPNESYMTKKGSLWTNYSKEFLNFPADADPRLNPRNTCIHHGYMSVLLVPLKTGNKVIGLLQMNKREAGKFTQEDVEFYEELGNTISIAYGRMLNEMIIKASKEELARNEDSLKEAETTARTLLNASGSTNILLSASDYKVLDINRAGSLLFESNSDDIKGSNAVELFRHISGIFTSKLNEALRESKTVRFQEERAGKHFYNQIYPIRNESGEIQRLAVFIQDITEIHQIKELRELNNELSELNATKDRLFSVLAHDLRSPVSGILNLTELLKKNLDKYEPAKSASFLKSILITSYQILNLLDNLTIWAKSRRGQIDFDPVHFKLNQVIPEVTEVMQSAATNKKISIESSIDDSVICYADINMMKCILRNLVQNSIKFTNIGGWVKIDAAMLPGIIEISVSDNGIGMNDNLIKSLFKKNTSVSIQGTSKEKGSGIGLLLCREFIERHSGSIKVESVPEKGSRFTVTFPLPES
jgi:signal transduction histidine kinase